MDRRYASLLVVLQLAVQASPQAFAELDINALRVRVHSNGLIGPDLATGTSAFTVPGANNIPLLYSSGLWMGGLTPDNQLRLSAHLYNTPPLVSFWPGPLTVTGDASITPDVSAQYDHVWKVTKAQVEAHLDWMECLQDPNCDMDVLFPGGYVVPLEFITWPAMGNVGAGQSLYIAPFNDFNGDGVYNPFDGDAPCIYGDQALFCVFNDKLPSGMMTPIGMETRMMVFAYDDDPALANTVFVFYKSINQGTQTLENFYYGNYADLEVGCGVDDFVGTDAPRGLVYALNGDAVDEDCADAPGAGAQPPALGMVVLKGPYLDADSADNAPVLLDLYDYGTGFGDGILDNEGHGLSGSMYWSADGNPAMTDPEYPTHFHNYLRAVWKDSSPLRYGGNGYMSSSIWSHYAFPGSSDAAGLGTGGVPQPSWTEAGAGNTPGDRRILASSGPFTLEPGQHSNLLYAYVYAPEGDLEALQEHVDSVRAFANDLPGLFDSPIANWPGCNPINTGIADGPSLIGASVYPNPAEGHLTIQLRGVQGQVDILVFDALGAEVLRTRTVGERHTLDTGTLAPGLYLVRAEARGRIVTARFVKDR